MNLNMSGKGRVLAVATAAAAGLIAFWAPTALASTTPVPVVNQGQVVNQGPVVNQGLVNDGSALVNLGSGNTAVGNTCNNINAPAPVGGGLLTWALNLSHNACVMAGGPAHF
jgi:hypothetical protein